LDSLGRTSPRPPLNQEGDRRKKNPTKKKKKQRNGGQERGEERQFGESHQIHGKKEKNTVLGEEQGISKKM